MEELVEALRRCVADANWYAGVALALAAPDICGAIAYPELAKKSQERYRQWFEAHLQGHFTRRVGEPRVYLSGNDCYALRCAFLHQGSEVIDGQSARERLSRFRLTEPDPSGRNRLNAEVEGSLRLEVKSFCEHVAEAVESWWNGLGDGDRRTADADMLQVYPFAASPLGGPFGTPRFC